MFACRALLFIHVFWLFFFNDPATTEIYPLSLHDALPIFGLVDLALAHHAPQFVLDDAALLHDLDRKSTRLNSSHVELSYAVFCLKKKTRYNDILNPPDASQIEYGPGDALDIKPPKGAMRLIFFLKTGPPRTFQPFP